MSAQPSGTAGATDYRRSLYAWERHTDFAALDDTYQAALVAAEAVIVRLRRQHLRALARNDDLSAEAQRRAVRALARRMEAAARRAARQAVLEARRQRVQASVPKLTPEDRRRVRAAAAAAVAASIAAFRRAIRRRASRRELEQVGLKDAARRVAAPALHVGRVRTLRETRPARLYASELLDDRTCSRCEAIDGREYDSMTEALRDYPAGGFARCFGGHRCRGTLVAEYAVARRAA